MRYALVRKTDHIVENVIAIEPSEVERVFSATHPTVFAVPMRDETEHAEPGWRFTGEGDISFVPLDAKRADEVFPDEDTRWRVETLRQRPAYQPPGPDIFDDEIDPEA